MKKRISIGFQEISTVFNVGLYWSLTFFIYFVQAFVGVAKDLNAIVIAFRGTQENRYRTIFVIISKKHSVLYAFGLDVNLYTYFYLFDKFYFAVFRTGLQTYTGSSLIVIILASLMQWSVIQ